MSADGIAAQIEEAVQLRRSALPLFRDRKFVDAAPLFEQSIAALRPLAAADLAAAGPQLGKSLASLGGVLMLRNEWEQALTVSTEATPLLRLGAVSEAAQYCGALAYNLHVIGEIFRKLEQFEPCIEAKLEALEFARRPECRLDQVVSAAMDVDTADTVRENLVYQCQLTLARVYTRTDRDEEALAVLIDGFETARHLTQRLPKRYCGILANHYRELAAAYAKRDDAQTAQRYRIESLQYWYDAVGYAREELLSQATELRIVSLTMALIGYALQLSALDRGIEALPYCREAVERSRALAELDPATHQALFELCQRNLAKLEQRP